MIVVRSKRGMAMSLRAVLVGPSRHARCRTIDEHDLRVGRHPHAESLLGDRADARATGGDAHLALERGALGNELRTLLREITELTRLGDAAAPAPHDRRG